MRHLARAILACAAVGVSAAPATADDHLNEGFGFHGVGVDLGLVDAENVDMTLAFGAHANLGAPFEGVPQLALVPRIIYWSKSESEGGSDFSFSELSIVVDARYFFPIDSPIDVFAGGGLGFHRASAETDIEGFGTADASDTDIGITLLGGVETELGEKIRGSGEFRLKFGGADEWFLLFGGTYALTQ